MGGAGGGPPPLPAPGMSPAARRPGGVDVVATDLDRTFTRADLSLDAEALATARQLRARGVVTVLATGRRAVDVAARPALQDAFDAFVLECGAVRGRWDDWQPTVADTAAVQALAARLRDAGCPIDEGAASCSAPAEWAPRIRASPEAPRLSVQPNRDRVDVVPAGIDKGVGLRAMLADMGLDHA